MAAYGTINIIDFNGLGGHRLGDGECQSRWTTTGFVRTDLLGDDYVWSPFDIGVARPLATLVTELETAQFERRRSAFVQVEYGRSFLLGLEYADCQQDKRADFSTWLSVPLKTVTMTAFWRQRRQYAH